MRKAVRRQAGQMISDCVEQLNKPEEGRMNSGRNLTPGVAHTHTHTRLTPRPRKQPQIPSTGVVITTNTRMLRFGTV